MRGRGLLASSIIRASRACPRHAPSYAYLMAVISSKLPECGELLLARAILAFRRTYRGRDRDGVSSVLALLGHLFNQGMAQELLSLQILTVLLDGDPTEDSVDVAVGYMCVVGRQLAEVSPAGVHAVMERFRGLLHEGSIGRRAQYRIETLLRIRKGGHRLIAQDVVLRLSVTEWTPSEYHLIVDYTNRPYVDFIAARRRLAKERERREIILS